MNDEQEAAASDPLETAPPAPPPAWEEIENGRFMPRRIKGSCIGRELG
jgi:hypothetical protein